MTEAFPLAWPAGWPRTKNPARSRFDVTQTSATSDLLAEVQRMGGRYAVISTNIPLRRDGLPYGNAREPTDSGVAVYFQLGSRQMVFACDRWDRVRDNMRAIAKTIEALRGIERWGASDMMERALSAFESLPAPSWKRDLMFADQDKPTWDEVEVRYRQMAKRFHPDVPGGDAEKFKMITAAKEAARRELAA